MNNADINTYCSGFSLIAFKNISKQTFVEMLNDLQNEFNEYYNTNEYSFNPECISEGGIIFNNFNNKEKYKTMRLYFESDRGRENLYGYISNNIKDKWITDESVLINECDKLGTYLKSFRGAPKWTNDELKIFQKCFGKVGLFIDDLPHEKELKMYDDSTYYLDLFNLQKY